MTIAEWLPQALSLGLVEMNPWLRSKRLGAIQPAFDAIMRIVDEVTAIDLATVEKAKQMVLAYRNLFGCGRRPSGRDGTTWNQQNFEF